MTYIGCINELICSKLTNTPNVVSFGQNIATGSCLSGLTRGLPTENGNLFINTTNSEYTLTGTGFGLMAEGVNGIFFLKQQDFLLLGIDHMVHTWNLLRARTLTGSFTIFAIVVDNGYEGPQSCINNLPDLCSISRLPGYSVSNKDVAESIINEQLVSPGARIICISQSLFKREVSSFDSEGELVDCSNYIYKYGTGEDVTIVSLNFAYTESRRLSDVLNENDIESSLFNVAAAIPSSWCAILKHAALSKYVVICDDSKGQSKASSNLAYVLKDQIPNCKVNIQSRKYEESWSWPNPDKYIVNDSEILLDFTKEN